MKIKQLSGWDFMLICSKLSQFKEFLCLKIFVLYVMVDQFDL